MIRLLYKSLRSILISGCSIHILSQLLVIRLLYMLLYISLLGQLLMIRLLYTTLRSTPYDQAAL